jgi:hypothetical protein
MANVASDRIEQMVQVHKVVGVNECLERATSALLQLDL